MKACAVTLAIVMLAQCVSAQAPVPEALPEILSNEWALHEKTRLEGIGRLGQQTRAQLEGLQTEQMRSGNLEAANAIQQALTALTDATSPAPKDLPPAAAAVYAQYLDKVNAGTIALNQQTIARLEKVKVDLLRSGNLPGANSADAGIRKLREELGKLSPALTKDKVPQQKADSFVVEALIDGNSELHVTASGIQWVIPGSHAKPGLHEGANEATYVNDRRWKPKWREKVERGPDRSDVYAIPTAAPKLFAQTLKVSKERFGENERRALVSTSVRDGAFVVTIPDPEGGSRWYKIEIRSAP